MARLFAGDGSSGHLWEIIPANPERYFSITAIWAQSVASGIGGLTVHGGSVCRAMKMASLYLINPDDPDDTSGNYGLVGALPSGSTDPQGMTSHNGNLYVIDDTRCRIRAMADKPG